MLIAACIMLYLLLGLTFFLLCAKYDEGELDPHSHFGPACLVFWPFFVTVLVVAGMAIGMNKLVKKVMK